MTICSGFLFQFWLGTLYVILSATIGSLCLFLSVRLAFSPYLINQSNKWIHKMRNKFNHNALQYLLFLRLTPIFPFWVVNIVPAVLGINTLTFVTATFFGIIPATCVYVALGSGLGTLLDKNQTPNLHIIFTPNILIPLLGISLLSLIPILYQWIKNIKKGK